MGKITGSGNLTLPPLTFKVAGEVSASAKDFIESRRRAPAGDVEPDVLYHYTSAAGLIGILSTGQVWATSIRHLNDASEFVHTLSLAELSSQNALNKHFVLDRYLIRSLTTLHASDILPPSLCYVASFSEKGNLLSQWRAYCPPGAGYSIGFSRAKLAAEAEATHDSQQEPWRLVHCEYDRAKQEKVVSGFLQDAREAFDALPEPEQDEYITYIRENFDLISEDPPWLSKAVESYVKNIETVAPAFKDPAFKEEAEWRVISPLVAVWNFDDEKYRAGRYCPVPYAEFKLPRRADDRLQVEKIIIGPTENPDLAEMTVRRLCGRFKVDIGARDIEQSNVPFRHWDTK